MERQYLRDIFEDLQTFVQLKQQNFLILAWIQLKKNIKLGNFASRTRGRHDQFRSNPNNTVSYNSNHIRINDLGRSQVSEYPRGHRNTDKYVTQYANARGLNEEMFKTFNKNGYLFIDEPEEDHFQPYCGNTTPYDQERELEDDDQFQDIVLDRLSKLEENINEMMKQKRLKEDLRGYVGAPIQQHRLQEDFQQELQIDTSGTFQYRLEKDADKIPRYKPDGHYQSWQTSPIKNKDARDPMKNLKYIPMPKDSPVNIHKIKNILEKSNREEDQNILDNPKYFSSKPSTDRRNPNTTQNIRQREEILPYSQRQVLRDPVKERIASALYYNRYGAAKTTRNNNQIHFVPKNIEMKTAIEPKTRYNRTINAAKNISGSVNRQTSNQVAFKPRKSGSSDSSGYSYLSMPSWRANLSSLY